MARVPMPPFDDRPIDPIAKVGWGTNWGTFTRSGITDDHSMVGFLMSTDAWFRRFDVAALTEWGIGGSADGLLDGKIIRWVDRMKITNVHLWSSGPANYPYLGDGPAYIAKYGINGVNGRGEAIELSDGGDIYTPVSYKQWVSLIWLKAAIAHRDGVTSDKVREVLAFMHHREFCKRSEPWPNDDKDCPFERVYLFTDQYINAILGLMRYFEGKETNLDSLIFRVATFDIDLRFIGKMKETGHVPAPTPVPAKPIFVDYIPDRTFTLKYHATVRQYASRQAKIYEDETAKMVPGTRLAIAGYYHGEMVNGSDKWAVQAVDPRGRIHESAFTERL